MNNRVNKKLKFLLIVPSYACTLTNGAGQRTSLLYLALQSLGGVDVVVIGYGEDGYLNELSPQLNDFFPNIDSLHVTVKPYARAELGFWRFFRPLNPKLLDLIATAFGKRSVIYKPDKRIASFVETLQRNTNYDLVICRYLRPSAPSGVFYSSQAPVVLDVDDRDDAIYKSRLNQPGLNLVSKLILTWHLRQSQDIVANLLPCCKHIWLASKADTQEVKHSSMSVLPNIPYVLDFEHSHNHCSVSRDSKTILFVGSFIHRVNREGIDRFVLNCWPIISATVKDATFRIVGSGGWEQLKDRFNHLPNVEVVGFKEDLEAEYQQAAFTVVPLFEGGGTKIKVLETLFYQRTSVVTTHAHYGYEELRDRESLLVARNESELANGCIELLTNFDLRERLAENGRRKVIDNYSFNHFSSVVRETIEKICK